MNTENPREKLKEYNEFFHKHAYYKTSVPKACNIAHLIHFVAWIIFLANLYPLTKWECLENFSIIPILKDIPSWMPFYSKNVWIFLLFGIVTVYVIPAWIGNRIASAIGNKTNFHNANQSYSDNIPHTDEDILRACEDIYKKYKPEGLGCAVPAVEMLAGIILASVMNHVLGWLIVIVFTAITDFIFCGITFSFKYSYEEKFEDFTKFKNELEAQDKIRKKEAAEKQRIESERQAEETRKKQAAAAEAYFLTLEKPEENEKLLTELADKESPSACLCLGRIMYHRFLTEALTKCEKEQLAEECEEYLEIAADAENCEAEFLLIGIRTLTESNDSDTWMTYLQNVRRIKDSGQLPEYYHDALDSLINSLIEIIDRTETKRYTIDYDTFRTFDTTSYNVEDYGVTGSAINAGMPLPDGISSDDYLDSFHDL